MYVSVICKMFIWFVINVINFYIFIYYFIKGLKYFYYVILSFNILLLFIICLEKCIYLYFFNDFYICMFL